jgi:UDP-N-acetylglucosamine 3-dehydrogenase
MQQLGVALLGCGFATRLHSRTLRGLKGVTRFYASRDAERAREYADRYKGAGHFGSYETAIEDPSVDVVLIATPPATHLPLTRQALAAGKHVIVEKPPFLHSTVFAEVELLAKEEQRRVFVAENYFYKPVLKAIRETIASGVIGDVRLLTINALKEQKADGWRDRMEDAGGGALFEGGIHWVNFMSSLGLSVEDVHGYRPGPSDGPDRTMVAVFRYAEGAVGTLYYSWEIGSPMKGLRLSSIYGTRGAITFESNGLLLGIRGSKRRVSMPKPTDLLGYSAMFEDFFRAIRTGSRAEFELEDARRDLELVERIYETSTVQRGTADD